MRKLAGLALVVAACGCGCGSRNGSGIGIGSGSGSGHRGPTTTSDEWVGGLVGSLPASPLPPQRLCRHARASVGTAKLVDPGTGPRTALRYAPRAGKQHLEIVYDSVSDVTAPPGQMRGEVPHARPPSIVVIGDAEVTPGDPSGYVVTITRVETRRAGDDTPVDEVEAMQRLVAAATGATITGAIGSTGIAGETAICVMAADESDVFALDFVVPLVPVWPVLPDDPVGAGATWQVVQPTEVVHIPVTDTIAFRLTSRDAAGWTATGSTTRVARAPVADRALSKLAGRGSVALSERAGVLFPTLDTGVVTDFTMTDTVTATARFETRLRVTTP